MSNERVEALLYESAAVLRLVDRELEALRAIAMPASEANEAPVAADAAAVGSEEVAHYDRSELLAGLDRVSRHLNDMPAATSLPVHPL